MTSKRLLLTALLALAALAVPARASAGVPDAGDAGDGGNAGDGGGGDDAGGGDDGGGGAPLACDGGLCDTANNATCSVAYAGTRTDAAMAFAIVLGAAAALRRRRAVAAGVVLATIGAATVAHAEPADGAPSVDVRIKDPPPPSRRVSIEWNPLPLFTIGRASANVVLVPIDHHALVISPFYAWAKTVPITILDANAQPVRVLPEQKFDGFGAEIGYRYYTGLAGPRGFFLGPSLIVGKFTAHAADGTDTDYTQLGVAADIGYQVIVADCLALSLGAGVQYAGPSKSIPDQQFPADLYANALVRPRVLSSIGWAF
jgi:MYXO-CTERM domain-containing protein